MKPSSKPALIKPEPIRSAPELPKNSARESGVSSRESGVVGRESVGEIRGSDIPVRL